MAVIWINDQPIIIDIINYHLNYHVLSPNTLYLVQSVADCNLLDQEVNQQA